MPRNTFGLFTGRVPSNPVSYTLRVTHQLRSAVLRLLPFLNSIRPVTSCGIGAVRVRVTIGRIRITGSPSTIRAMCGLAAMAAVPKAGVVTTKGKSAEDGSTTTWS